MSFFPSSMPELVPAPGIAEGLPCVPSLVSGWTGNDTLMSRVAEAASRDSQAPEWRVQIPDDDVPSFSFKTVMQHDADSFELMLTLFGIALANSSTGGLCEASLPVNIILNGLPSSELGSACRSLEEKLGLVPDIKMLKELDREGNLLVALNMIDERLVPLFAFLTETGPTSLRSAENPVPSFGLQFDVNTVRHGTRTEFNVLKSYVGRTFFAFHGSPVINFFSILQIGLKNLSDTPFMRNGRSQGPGVYLALDFQQSATYSSSLSSAQCAWKGSSLVDSNGVCNLSILALVEVIDQDVNKHGQIAVAQDARVLRVVRIGLFPASLHLRRISQVQLPSVQHVTNPPPPRTPATKLQRSPFCPETFSVKAQGPFSLITSIQKRPNGGVSIDIECLGLFQLHLPECACRCPEFPDDDRTCLHLRTFFAHHLGLKPKEFADLDHPEMQKITHRVRAMFLSG